MVKYIYGSLAVFVALFSVWYHGYDYRESQYEADQAAALAAQKPVATELNLDHAEAKAKVKYIIKEVYREKDSDECATAPANDRVFNALVELGQ